MTQAHVTQSLALEAGLGVAPLIRCRGKVAQDRRWQVEPWTDPEGFAVSAKLKDISDLIANADRVHRQNQAAKLDQIESWVKQSREALAREAEPPAFPGPMPEHPLRN